MIQYHNAPQEEQLRSEYEHRMQMLQEAMQGISDYCCKLDGTKSELQLKLIYEIQDALNNSSMGDTNVHEATQGLQEEVQTIKKHNIQYAYDSYRTREIFIAELMQFFSQEDYSYQITYECPVYDIVVSLETCDLLIQNTCDETMQLYCDQVLLLETRNMQLIINQIEFINKLTRK